MDLPLAIVQLGPMASEAVIEAEAVSKEYGPVRALRNLNLLVRRGEIFGFLGPNGAGKTTFIKILLDFVRINSGSVRVLGSPPGQLDRRRIGYLPERIAIHPFLSAREFLMYHTRLLAIPAAERAPRVARVLERVHMSADADRRIGGYSKGMTQRIGIAQALLGEPELLLLDEPISGLDPIGIQQIRQIILEERERGATVFVNSHQLLEVEKTCDRVAILNKGLLAAQGSRDELSARRGLHLQLDQMTDGLRRLVLECDPSAQIDGAAASLHIADEEQERRFPAKIVEAGGRILSYSQSRESLEEVFHRLVQNGPDQAGAA